MRQGARNGAGHNVSPGISNTGNERARGTLLVPGLSVREVSTHAPVCRNPGIDEGNTPPPPIVESDTGPPGHIVQLGRRRLSGRPLHTPQRTRNRREPGFLLVSISSHPSMTTFAIRSEIHRDVPAVQSADTQFTARLPGRTQAASPGTARRTSTTSTASSRGHSRAGRCDSAPAPRRAPGRCRSRRRASQP